MIQSMFFDNKSYQIRQRPVPTNHQLPRNIPPFLQKILAARGLLNKQDVDFSLKYLPSPTTLKGAAEASELLFKALEQQKKILIVGDYDVDGATSTALAMSCLEEFHAHDIDFIIPDRSKLGYGLSTHLLEKIPGKPDLILTVDNGISSVDAVQKARDNGIEVIITDHHLPGECLPAANAIVNPCQQGCNFVSKNLAGVGVIFYVMAALRSLLIKQSWFLLNGSTPPNLAKYLDLVAFGTVADAVSLDAVNRILVEQGLRRIRQGKANYGIRALAQTSKRPLAELSSSDLGYSLAPRLNAIGRLENMRAGVDCLLSKDFAQALILAKSFDKTNVRRKLIEKNMRSKAHKLIAQQLSDLHEEIPPAICLFDKKWHEGVVGIVAGRISERCYRPAIVFAQGADNDFLKGSGRSIEEINIKELLEEIAHDNPELIINFGGHSKAVGLKILPANFAEFKLQFLQVVAKKSQHLSLTEVIDTDGELASNLINIKNAALLNNYCPWGQNFAAPSFDGIFEVLSERLLSGNHLSLELRTSNDGDDSTLEAIGFNQAEYYPLQSKQIRVIYRLNLSNYHGAKKVQLFIERIFPANQP